MSNTLDPPSASNTGSFRHNLPRPTCKQAPAGDDCRYYAMPAIPGNVTIIGSCILCSHYAQLCNGILPLTQGLGQATCRKLADYGYMQL